jgi:response regulator RpfG family c-di-GMP phosphodiesterase
MPNKNGLTTLINLNVRQSCDEEKGIKRIPVIIATGLQGDVIRDLMMSQRIAGYLKKPYSAEELISKVKASIDGN